MNNPAKPRMILSEGNIVEGKPQRWMNPLEKIGWRKAIKARQTTHTISDGRKFTLDYTRRKGKVLIKPADGSFVPMCWLDIERVEMEDGEWIVKD